MDKDENPDINIDEEVLKYQKLQNDAVRLMRVLDICLDNVDGLYAYILRKKFLGMSKDN